MKILLIAPVSNYRADTPSQLSMSDFPAGIAYIAAALKEAGHEVHGLNPNNATNYQSNYYMLVNKINEALQEKPDLVGLGGICTDYQFFKDAIELIRKFSPGTPIVLGGGIISNDREFIFTLLKPDFGIVGEGEETVVRLAKRLMDGSNGCYPNIDNLSFWDGDKAIHNPRNFNYGRVDSRPLPDYEPFGIRDMLDNYSMATRPLYRYCRTDPRPMTIVTARGCPFNCTFCIHRGNQLYRPRTIEDVMEEIRINEARYNFNILIILDELFAVNKQRMKDFCEGVLEGRQKYGWDFNWMFQTHASAALDYESLALAKEAGCFFFSYGLESASPRVLKSMNKRMKVPQIVEALELADRVGIGFGGNLIFGDVAETQGTIYESMDFFYKYCQKAFVFTAMLMPYPGNKLFDTCMERGLIKDKAIYYANIDNGVFNMTTMPDDIWYQWVNFLTLFERTWLWVKSTEAVEVTLEPTHSNPVSEFRHAQIYRIKAVCPYCGRTTEYREMIGQRANDLPLFLGTGCTYCNRRIKINLSDHLLAPRQTETKERVAVLV